MNTFIKVSTNSIANDAQEIDQLVNSIPELLKELEAAMGELSNCWEGAAWHNYQANVNHYIEMLLEIYKYMKNYAVKLQESSEVYHRAEQDVCTSLKILGVFC